MAVMSKRHPGRVRLRIGATPRGEMFAAEVDYLLDGGAYATLSPVVLFRGTVHACGPYRVPNAKVDARVVRTHKVPCGAFRGFGEPQVVFAFESAMDELAERAAHGPAGAAPAATRCARATRPSPATCSPAAWASTRCCARWPTSADWTPQARGVRGPVGAGAPGRGPGRLLLRRGPGRHGQAPQPGRRQRGGGAATAA